MEAEPAAAKEMATTDVAPRRGTRVRQPTRKAEEIAHVDVAAAKSADGANGKAVADPANTGRARGRSSRSKSVAQGAEEDPQILADKSADRMGNSNGDGDGAEDEEVYCICRGPDDGRPMVWCVSCDDW